MSEDVVEPFDWERDYGPLYRACPSAFWLAPEPGEPKRAVIEACSSRKAVFIADQLNAATGSVLKHPRMHNIVICHCGARNSVPRGEWFRCHNCGLRAKNPCERDLLWEAAYDADPATRSSIDGSMYGSDEVVRL